MLGCYDNSPQMDMLPDKREKVAFLVIFRSYLRDSLHLLPCCHANRSIPSCSQVHLAPPPNPRNGT